MHFVAIFNQDGGTFRTMDIGAFVSDAEQIFATAGHTIECRPVGGDKLAAALAKGVRELSADVLIAGGGDGTISAAAAACFKAGKALAVLPAGTMNLFARSLGMPLDLLPALEAIAGGELSEVDIATANGRPFVHQYSVGMHSRLVRIRNSLEYSNRLGKIFASLRAVGEALRRPLRFDAVIRTGTRIETRRATAVSVSNNPLSEGHVPYAEVIDRGLLGVYVVRPMSAMALGRLLLGVIVGNWKRHPLVTESEVTEVTLAFPRRKSSAHAVIDGELVPLPDEVTIKIQPRALSVVRPAKVTVAPELAA
jgi:diacylglycerol kinase family enzyme